MGTVTQAFVDTDAVCQTTGAYGKVATTDPCVVQGYDATLTVVGRLVNLRNAIDCVVLIAVLVAPVVAFVRTRSLTWTIVSSVSSISLMGAMVGLGIELGHRWTMVQLQWMLVLACAAVIAAAFLLAESVARSVRHQLLSVLVPMLSIAVILVVSRLFAGRSGSLFAAVGYFVANPSGEDNAKWLDFTSQAVTGDPVEQSVALGGALQLALVAVVTLLSVVSLVLLGGVNEVFVSANTVLYSQLLLIAIVPMALAPVAEMRLRRVGYPASTRKAYLPPPMIWAGALVLATANAALLNFGHMTLQWVILVVTLWIAVFLVPGTARRTTLLSSLAVVLGAGVWFPLLPVSLVVLLSLGIWLTRDGIRGRSLRRVDWIGVALLIIVVATMARTAWQTLLYMTDQPLLTTTNPHGGAAGGIAKAARIPALQLLESRGGTEVVAPILAILATASVVLASLLLTRQLPVEVVKRRLLRFAPLLLLSAYALAISTVGTWWAGIGPEYGAQKTLFMVTIAALGATLPLSIAWLATVAYRMTTTSWVAIGCVLYLLTVDSLLPRALLTVSPQRWPQEIEVSSDYWWPAEVRKTPRQAIHDSPVACAYLPNGGDGPTALPNGQIAYSCTRILAGLSGQDAAAQGLVDWSRREWLTNEKAWTAVWPDLVTMPYSVRGKQMIILDSSNNVIGLETVNSMLDRYRPEWAVGKPLTEFTG